MNNVGIVNARCHLIESSKQNIEPAALKRFRKRSSAGAGAGATDGSHLPAPPLAPAPLPRSSSLGPRPLCPAGAGTREGAPGSSAQAEAPDRSGHFLAT